MSPHHDAAPAFIVQDEVSGRFWTVDCVAVDDGDAHGGNVYGMNFVDDAARATRFRSLDDASSYIGIFRGRHVKAARILHYPSCSAAAINREPPF